MKRLLFSVLLVLPLSVFAQVPWKAHAGVGLMLPDAPGASAQPFVEASAFVQALDPPPPEFFQAGARVAWDPQGFSVAVGVRHKLYFVPSAATGQEVLVGRRFSALGDAWTLAGRFGVGVPWQASEALLPSTDLDLVWELDWTPERGIRSGSWGVAVGLGGGEAAPPR